MARSSASGIAVRPFSWEAISTVSPAVVSLVVFVAFSIQYVAFRSGDIFAVDGAYRCLEVYRRQKLFIDGSNHLLYPVFVFAWQRFIAIFGFRPAEPYAFFRLIEIMNCLAAAGCVAILCWLAIQATRNWRAAAGLTIGFGLSKAFLEQATNANEPILGLLWSLTGMLFAAVGFHRGQRWPFFVSGLFFALATASYQSMIFLAPAAVVLAWQSPERKVLRGKRGVSSLVWLLAGGIAGFAVFYVPALAFLKITQSALTNGGPLKIAGAHAWFGVNAGRVLNVPVGMVQNIFPVLTNFTGIRALLRGPTLPLIYFLAALAAVAALIFVCAKDIWGHRAMLSGVQRAGVFAATAGFTFSLIPVLFFSPNYDKLWLQPLACLAFALAVALSGNRNRSPFEQRIRSALVAGILASVMTNFAWAVPRHRVRSIQGLRETDEFAKIVKPDDFVVGDWNAISVLYQQLWPADGHYVDFVDLAAQEGRSATRDMNEAILRTQQRGGDVYFIGLLDDSKQSWDGFLASRCGIPFSDADMYRNQSRIVSIFRLPSEQITVRRLNRFPPVSP